MMTRLTVKAALSTLAAVAIMLALAVAHSGSSPVSAGGLRAQKLKASMSWNHALSQVKRKVEALGAMDFMDKVRYAPGPVDQPTIQSHKSGKTRRGMVDWDHSASGRPHGRQAWEPPGAIKAAENKVIQGFGGHPTDFSEQTPRGAAIQSGERKLVQGFGGHPTDFSKQSARKWKLLTAAKAFMTKGFFSIPPQKLVVTKSQSVLDGDAIGKPDEPGAMLDFNDKVRYAPGPVAQKNGKNQFENEMSAGEDFR